ncbi:MAG TPA: type IV toxin-antitoxin system AbiEi family antitoxin domain-containing protein [Solirubrobacteraceae bacterium]|jgi:hypothetical protein
MRSNFAVAARIATRQHGRVTWRQLVAAGVDRHAVQRWLVGGRLHRVHDGVYAVGHVAPSVHGDYMAAVLACGRGAVLSHGAAAHLLKILPGSAPPPEVTVPTVAGRRRTGIVIHRVHALPVQDTSILDRIPIATVPRVLLDVSPRLDAAELGRACHEAWVRHGTSPREIEACIARNPAKKGVARLRRAVGSDVTLSVLEDGFLQLLRDHGLPAPRTNIDRDGDRVDCHWPAIGLTVELLSYRYHGSRAAFERDVARRRRSQHVAFTYGDVFERSRQTIAELGAAMGSSERSGRP